jgi:hypothetical protein
MSVTAKLILTVVFLGGFITAWMTARAFPPDDDLLYFYSAAQSIVQPEEYAVERDKAHEIMSRAQTEKDDSVLRFEFRDKYRYNYIYDLVLLAAARAAVMPAKAISDPAEYLSALRDSLYAGAFLSHGLVILLSVILLWRMKSHVQWGYFFALLVSFGGFMAEYFNLWPQIPYQLIYSDLTESMKRPILALVHPGIGFGFFYTNARNVAVMLSAIIFALRWNGQIKTSYILCVLMTFMHATSATLIVIMLAGLDYLHSPARLKEKMVIAAIAVVSMIGLIQSSVWGDVGRGISAFSLLPLVPYLFLGVDKHVMPLREKTGLTNIEDDNKYLLDGLFLAVGLFALFTVLWFFYYLTHNTQDYKYTLGELPVRLLSLLRFPFWMIAGMWMMKSTSVRAQFRLKQVIIVFAVALVGLAVFYVVRLPPVQSPVGATLILYEGSKEKCHHPFSEKVIYYLIACKLDGMCKGLGGEDYMKRCYSAAEYRK